MNRRIVIPALFICLALCFAIIALPAEGASSGARLQSTQQATVDPCNPKPAIPGVVVADYVAVLQKALTGSPEVLYVRKLDVVSVIGKTTSSVWVEVQTNSGLVGWLPSAYVQIDPRLFRKIDVVDGLAAVAQPTPVGTDDASNADVQATATAVASACPNFTGTVTGDLVALKTQPITTSKDVGTNVRQTEQVTILGLNASGSWFKIRTKDGVEGWVTSSYVYVAPAKLASIRHDYSSAEVTLTPSN